MFVNEAIENRQENVIRSYAKTYMYRVNTHSPLKIEYLQSLQVTNGLWKTFQLIVTEIKCAEAILQNFGKLQLKFGSHLGYVPFRGNIENRATILVIT